MKQTSPPAIASWMLEHLTPGIRNDALAGDLQEEFQYRQSARWYWRQVLAAMATEFLKQGAALLPAAFFAALWTIPIPALQFHAFRSLEGGSLFTRIVQLDWPYSAFGEVAFENIPGLFLIWSGLIVYLWIHFKSPRRARLANLWRGMLTSFPVLILSSAVLAGLSYRRSFNVQYVTVMRLIVSPFSILMGLPFFLSLFLSIAIALPRPERATPGTAA
jgi:hypothetical protein